MITLIDRLINKYFRNPEKPRITGACRMLHTRLNVFSINTPV